MGINLHPKSGFAEYIQRLKGGRAKPTILDFLKKNDQKKIVIPLKMNNFIIDYLVISAIIRICRNPHDCYDELISPVLPLNSKETRILTTENLAFTADTKKIPELKIHT